MAVNQQTRANFSARDLVTPADPNVTGTAAVTALADATSKGLITTDEILQRVGPRAHKQAQLEDLVREQATEDIKDPLKAAGRQAVQAQTGDLLKRAINAGAPLPRDAEDGVDFDRLFEMAPQIAAYERQEKKRIDNLTELQESFVRAANKSPTSGDRNIYVSWRGQNPITTDAEYQQERQRLSTPSTFTEMFPQAGAQTQTGAPQIAQAPAGEIVGQPVQQPAQAPVAPQTSAGGATAGTPSVDQGVQPAQPAAQQGSFFPTRVGGKNAPTEVQTKAFMANARFDQLEPVLEAIEDSDYDLTGKWDTFRRWVADRVPDWAPWVGFASLPGEAQMYQAAVKGWAQGLLRLESGAAITVKEEASYVETFMPRAGDSPETMVLKREMRRTMADAIEQVATGIRQAEQAGNAQMAEQLRTEYEIARDEVIDYVQTQSALDRGIGPEIAAGIRPKGSGPAPDTNTRVQGTSVAQQPGFQGVDPATGLPVFNQPAQPVVTPR